MNSVQPIFDHIDKFFHQYLEPQVWPNIGGSAPFYLFSRVLKQPFTMGGLGHGGRVHSPNEFALVDGIRLYEKSVVQFLYEFGSI